MQCLYFSLALVTFFIFPLLNCVLLSLEPIGSNCLIVKARLLILILQLLYLFYYWNGFTHLLGVRYRRLMQVLRVWCIVGYVGLCMLYCRYVIDKVNYLLYIICLLFARRISFNGNIYP